MAFNIFSSAQRFLEDQKKRFQPVIQSVQKNLQPRISAVSGAMRDLTRRVAPIVSKPPVSVIAPKVIEPIRRFAQKAAPFVRQAPISVLAPKVEKFAERTGKALQQFPSTTYKPPSPPSILPEPLFSKAQRKVVEFGTGLFGEIMRGYGRTMEQVSTPKGRKEFGGGLKTIFEPPKTTGERVASMFGPAPTIAKRVITEPQATKAAGVLADLSDLGPGGFVFGGVRAVGKQAVKKLGKEAAKQVAKKAASEVGEKVLKSSLADFDTAVDIVRKGLGTADDQIRATDVIYKTAQKYVPVKELRAYGNKVDDVIEAVQGKAVDFDYPVSRPPIKRPVSPPVEPPIVPKMAGTEERARVVAPKPALFGKTEKVEAVPEIKRINLATEPTAEQIAKAEADELVMAREETAREVEPIVSKIKNFLRIVGEKRSAQTGELFREHIPRKVFGISSDEVASALGKTENEFMQEMTRDIEIISGGRASAQTIRSFRANVQKLDKIYDRLDPEFYTTVKDFENKVLAVSAEATPKTLERIAKRYESDAERLVKIEYRKSQAETLKATREAEKEVISEIQRVTVSPLSKAPEELKDISGFAGGFRDLYRNFKAVFGQKYEDAKRVMLDPFDRSKGALVDNTTKWLDEVGKIENKLGIRMGSSESAAVQLYGEKQFTYEDLVGQFGQKKADTIVGADNWFRQAYDQLLNEVNLVRTRIYPNNPEMVILRREDYYRHFREMAEGFQGLKNIFETPAGIQSTLAGVSEYTKPKSRFLSFAQRRLGIKTDVDAVGGFLNYLNSSMYAKHIDPHIGNFRALRQELADQTTEGAAKGSLNNFIEYLDDFANDLAGKTNPFDRGLQKWFPGGRATFRAVRWLNSRVKANTILGNVSSSIAQVFNIPQGIAEGGLINSAKGLGKTLASLFSENTPIKQSDFLKTRYFRAYDKFDRGILDNAKKFAVWLTQVGDEIGTKYIWNTLHEKALANGIENPVKYADEITRNLVAGRGIGEVPLAQKSTLFQVAAPFQLEVANLWWVLKDMVDEKAFGKIVTLFFANYLFNNAAEAIRGSAVTLDPIQAMLDALEAYQSEGNKKVGLARAGGRIAGEVLANVPLGQTAAAMYPEYGVDIGGERVTRKELFGRVDPTRFGGGILVAKGLSDPLFKVLPPFGGVQAKKTIGGISAFRRGYSETSGGRVRYPMSQDVGTAARTTLFGEYATPEARAYFLRGESPLGEKQTKKFLRAENPEAYYEKVMEKRTANRDVKKQAESVYNELLRMKGRGASKEERDQWWEEQRTTGVITPAVAKEVYNLAK